MLPSAAMRHASLPWYDVAEVHASHDALWAALAGRLLNAGVVDVPTRLEREVDYVRQWQSGKLLLGQACGYDVATWQAETLRVLLDALAASDGLGSTRAQVLNSLGTLYVVLGAYGAATAVLEQSLGPLRPAPELPEAPPP